MKVLNIFFKFVVSYQFVIFLFESFFNIEKYVNEVNDVT